MVIAVIITLNTIFDSYCGDHYFKYDLRWLLRWSLDYIRSLMDIVVIIALYMVCKAIIMIICLYVVCAGYYSDLDFRYGL